MKTRAMLIGMSLVGMISLITGCQTTPTLKDREPIYIPVSSCPAPPDFEPIKLPIDDLSADSTNAEVVKAFAASIEILLNEIHARDEVLNAYRKKSLPLDLRDIPSNNLPTTPQLQPEPTKP